MQNLAHLADFSVLMVFSENEWKKHFLGPKAENAYPVRQDLAHFGRIAKKYCPGAKITLFVKKWFLAKIMIFLTKYDFWKISENDDSDLKTLPKPCEY